MAASDILLALGAFTMIIGTLFCLGIDGVFFILILLGIALMFAAGMIGDLEYEDEVQQRKMKEEIRHLEVDLLNKAARELGFEPNYDYKKLIERCSVNATDPELRRLQIIRKNLMIKVYGKKKVNELLALGEKI